MKQIDEIKLHYERILDVVLIILDQMVRLSKPIGEIDFSALEEDGYSQVDISQALSWITDSLAMKNRTIEQDIIVCSSEEYSNKPSTKQTPVLRYLHPMERQLFSKEAAGELITLQMLGVITAPVLEKIIERAVLTNSDSLFIREMSLKDFHRLVAYTMFNDSFGNLIGKHTMPYLNNSIH